MVPLKDENPIQITPIVTYVLITANIVIFIYQLSLGTSELQELLQNFAFIPGQLSETLQGVHRRPRSRTPNPGHLSVSPWEHSPRYF